MRVNLVNFQQICCLILFLLQLGFLLQICITTVILMLLKYNINVRTDCLIKKEILFKQVSLMCKIILFYYSKKTMRKYGHICEFKAGKFFFKYPIAFLNIAFNSL